MTLSRPWFLLAALLAIAAPVAAQTGPPKGGPHEGGPRAGRPRTVSPFLIAGGGFSTHSDRFAFGTFRSSEGAFALGGGTRVHVTDHVYGMVDFRIGWELHYRVTGGVGVSM